MASLGLAAQHALRPNLRLQGISDTDIPDVQRCMNLLLLILYRAWCRVLRRLRAMAELKGRRGLAGEAVQVAVQVSAYVAHKHKCFI